MSNCYESMSWTPIRDRPLRQPLIRHSRHPFVNPAPHSSFRRRPESRRGGGVRLSDGGKNRPIAPLSSSYAAFARPWRFRRSKACPVPRYGAGIQGVWRGVVALGLVPSLGRTARSHKLHRPASHRFHPLMRPSQGHGDSRQPSFTRIDEIYQFCRQRRVHGRRPGTSLKLDTASPRHCSTSGRLESYVSPNDTRRRTGSIPISSAPVSSRSLPSPT